ncbi:hypothetical protein [Phenylobacterium sp.]|jgi:hypothetical protein
MTTQYNLRSFRLLSVGGAKALTNEHSNGVEIEEDGSRFPPL